jgi:hypothetical protein
MPTTATSHRSRATLQQVALSHARSRALSGETQEVFQHIANGETIADLRDLGYTSDMFDDSFFEAATSCATRAGQSYSRRVMCSDLMALRAAFLAGESVAPAEYHLNVVVKGASPAAVDLFERALRAFQHEGVTVESVEGV